MSVSPIAKESTKDVPETKLKSSPNKSPRRKKEQIFCKKIRKIKQKYDLGSLRPVVTARRK